MQGAFADLSTLGKGDEVDTDTPSPELRLITCGPGPLDSTGHNYLNQTVIWAKKV